MELKSRSQILGIFQGWEGHSIYQLANGQVWRQNYHPHQHQHYYIFMPRVKVWYDGSKYFFEVEGTDEMVEVRRATINDIAEEENERKNVVG